MNKKLLQGDSVKNNFLYQFIYQFVVLVIPLIVSTIFDKNFRKRAFRYLYIYQFYSLLFRPCRYDGNRQTWAANYSGKKIR